MYPTLQRALTTLKDAFVSFLNTIPYLKLKYQNLKMYVLPDGFGSLEENLLEMHNIYFNPDEIAKAKTIVDLGAHHGSFTLYAIYNAQPYTRIIAVEPMPKAYRMLINNISLYKNIIRHKKLTVIPLNAAVWKERTIVNLVITRWSEASHITTTGNEKLGKVVSVRTVTMDDLLNKTSRPVIIKMDIEGAEYALFQQPQWLERVDAISIEVHGDAKEIVDRLAQYGFNTHIEEVVIDLRLSKAWLKVRPLWYGLLIGFYRSIVSSMYKPMVKVIKARRYPSSRQ